ncbi:hypothetical protein [Alteraurantiacibacter palmitatis]|uniref:Nucleotidyltransferase n=1 Tax=Alteraurantiacibacter palmitatis TaxID=2054628 RepID=A0ABV7E6K3_9SPHN
MTGDRSADLDARLASVLTREVHPAITGFAQGLARESGAAGHAAVLFYGSNLRTGSLDGVLDYYLLLPGPAEKGLWPRVSYREWQHEGETLRAKIAAMTLAKFAEACRGDTLDTTIWARFVQPCALVHAGSAGVETQVLDALGEAARTAARLAAACGPVSGTEEEFWRALFRATYRAELRVEKPGRENSILEANAAHFAGLLRAALTAQGIAVACEADGAIRPDLPPARRAAVLRWWNRRRRMGKPLNIARLLRAARTFDGAGRYVAWKVERHTGIHIPMTPWREAHPVLAAPGVIWQLWREGKLR